MRMHRYVGRLPIVVDDDATFAWYVETWAHAQGRTSAGYYLTVFGTGPFARMRRLDLVPACTA